MLVIAYSKDEVLLDDQKHLENANSMNIDIALGWLEDHTGAPIFGRPEGE